MWQDCTAAARPAHPHRAEACAVIEAAEGDLDRLPGSPGVRCTAEYALVTLFATGTCRDRTIEWTRTYTNPYRASAATGPLFAF